MTPVDLDGLAELGATVDVIEHLVKQRGMDLVLALVFAESRGVESTFVSDRTNALALQFEVENGELSCKMDVVGHQGCVAVVEDVGIAMSERWQQQLHSLVVFSAALSTLLQHTPDLQIVVEKKVRIERVVDSGSRDSGTVVPARTLNAYERDTLVSAVVGGTEELELVERLLGVAEVGLVVVRSQTGTASCAPELL